MYSSTNCHLYTLPHAGKLSGVYDRFLSRLQDKEATLLERKPSLTTTGMSHADGTRLQLHRLTTALLATNVDDVVVPTIAEPSWDIPPAAASSSSGGSGGGSSGGGSSTPGGKQDAGADADDYGG